MSRQIFIAVPSESAMNNWPIAWWAGQADDGQHWAVTTNGVNASAIVHYSEGAKADAELIARLLNWYHNNREEAEKVLVSHE